MARDVILQMWYNARYAEDVMCGIAGIVYNEAGQAIADGRTGKIARMLGTIKYRGPDDSGEYYFDRCALGHVRLSIVDLTGGKQPMIWRDTSTTTNQPRPKLGIVFNGEIYGYKDIRCELSRDASNGGYDFATDSDTEVIIALYRKYGGSMMEHLPGMFAFALWDDEAQSLLCARDRFGEKPFYYAIGKGGEFIFASEIKAILASALVEPVLDYGQLHHYLEYGYVYPTRTIYRNIHTLPPAHTLTYRDGKITLERYWHLPPTNTLITEQEAVEEFRRLFKQAVRRQLVADVPVAAFLSGGLDSGSVAATAAGEVPRLTTISFAFKDGKDESSMARSMAERYRTNHIEIRDIDANFVDMLHKMQAVFDEPYFDPAEIPAYLISKEARKYATVVLTGDAGDEMLGGYDAKYRALVYMRRILDSPVPLKLQEYWIKGNQRIRKHIMDGLTKLMPHSSNTILLHDKASRKLRLHWVALRDIKLGIDNTTELARSAARPSPWGWTDAMRLPPCDDDYLTMDGFLDGNALDNAIRVDLHDYLPGDEFVKTDRTTMAVSLESRTPFCDKDLAEFCISLPFEMKVRGDCDKYILHKALGSMWTPTVRSGVKNGFAPPLQKWCAQSDYIELEHSYLCNRNSKLFDILPYDAVGTRLKTNDMMPRLLLLQLAMWLESHPCALH